MFSIKFHKQKYKTDKKAYTHTHTYIYQSYVAYIPVENFKPV